MPVDLPVRNIIDDSVNGRLKDPKRTWEIFSSFLRSAGIEDTTETMVALMVGEIIAVAGSYYIFQYRRIPTNEENLGIILYLKKRIPEIKEKLSKASEE
jgi:hypothetical protein